MTGSANDHLFEKFKNTLLLKVSKVAKIRNRYNQVPHLTFLLKNMSIKSDNKRTFRSDRSTTDNLVRFETFIRDAFIKKEHVVAVFFDLEKSL